MEAMLSAEVGEEIQRKCIVHRALDLSQTEGELGCRCPCQGRGHAIDRCLADKHQALDASRA